MILFCFLPASASLLAQSVEDSSSVIKELTLDDPEETDRQVEESSTNDEYNFIEKEDRYNQWKPSAQKNIPDSTIKILKEEDAFWYADLAPEKRKQKEYKGRNTSSGIPIWLNTLIWIVIIGGFAFFIITYLGGSTIGLFRKKNMLMSEEDSASMPEDIFAINYQKEIDKAAATGNYRLAVRLMFLRLLKNMSERNIINYKQDKTNFDYLSDLQNTSWYKQFFKVTRNYEYTWYGQFEISEEAYHFIRNDFTHFENQLS